MAVLAAAAIGLAGSSTHAADPAPATTTVRPAAQRNSLGMEFAEVAGTPLLFAMTETRVADWNAFLAASGYKWSYKTHFLQTNEDPVVNINLHDAIAFCNWLTEKERSAGTISALQAYRLPTSREWDAAAGLDVSPGSERITTQKALDDQTYPWGVDWPPPPKAGNFNSLEINGTDDGFAYTAPVGRFAPSRDGLFDLGGNAWEWTWNPDLRGTVAGKLRGGSWMYFRRECLLSGYQYEVPADLRAPSFGFRVVLEDKHRTAIFLAGQEKRTRELDQQRREQVMSRPGVNAEEVARMREQLTGRASTPGAAASLPDPNSLKPAQPDREFTSSIGLVFRPGGSTRILVCETETRVQDYLLFTASMKTTWEKRPAFEFKPNHPIMNVTWQEAKKFCEWLTDRDRAFRLIPEKASYRLPTDVEWSAAAGLTDETGDTPAARHLGNKSAFPWGAQVVPPPGSANLDTANIAGYQDNYSHTAPVASFAPNTLRLHDIAGNVAEWCEDAWPGSTAERVIRGSSYLSSSRDSLLSSARQHAAETMTRADVGFRCVLELPAP